MPLGDSISQAYADRYSYRYWLWQKMVDSGISYQFVGSMTDNHTGNPAWPNYSGLTYYPTYSHHEAHWGWAAHELAASLPGWMNDAVTGYTPDIVLVHAGTNDLDQGEATATILADYDQIIAALRAKNPNVTILLAKLIPHGGWWWNPGTDQLNDQMDAYAATKNTASSKVLVVDQHTGFVMGVDNDGAHPFASGEQKMADNFYAAIMACYNNNSFPTASLTNPAQGAVLTMPVNLTLAATATDSDGTVAKVEFYLDTYDPAGLNGATNSVLLGIDNNGADGWSFSWNNPAAGTYGLVAKAYDNGGARGTCNVVHVTVVPIDISATPANTIVIIGQTATLTVTATGQATITYQWQSAPPGSSTFTDISGATSASYTTSTVTSGMLGTQYHCVLTNPQGTVTSNATTLTTASSSSGRHCGLGTGFSVLLLLLALGAWLRLSQRWPDLRS
jgi:hypothetical protein